MARNQMYVAMDSFTYFDNGAQIPVSAGDRIREGHPALQGRESLFKTAEEVDVDVEAAINAPGHPRAGRRGQRAQRGAGPASGPAAPTQDPASAGHPADGGPITDADERLHGENREAVGDLQVGDATEVADVTKKSTPAKK